MARLGLLVFFAFFAVSFCQIPDYSFRDAIDATLTRMKADGSYTNLLPLALARSGFLPVDCAVNPPQYPFPNRTSGTYLDKVLSDGTVKVASASVQSTSSQQELNAFTAELLKRLGTQYGVTLTTQIVQFNSSTLALDSVTSGTTHFAAPNYSYGGTYKGLGRKYYFYQPCGWLDGIQMFTVLSTSTLNSLSDIKSSTKPLKSATNGAGTLNTVQAVLPSVSFALNTTSVPADLLAALRAGTLDFLPLGLADLTVEGLDTTGLREFTGGFNRLNGALLPLSTLPCATSAPSTCPPTQAPTQAPTQPPAGGQQGSVININFAGLLAR